jgi:hypothetical protein
MLRSDAALVGSIPAGRRPSLPSLPAIMPLIGHSFDFGAAGLYLPNTERTRMNSLRVRDVSWLLVVLSVRVVR